MPRVAKQDVTTLADVEATPARTAGDDGRVNGFPTVLLEVPMGEDTRNTSRRHIELDLSSDLARPLIRLANALQSRGVLINGRAVEGTTSAARWLIHQLRRAMDGAETP